MQQRPMRPDGTDGSDHEFRMVVEDRYKQAAAGKLRLRKLIVCQSFFYGVRGVWAALSLHSIKVAGEAGAADSAGGGGGQLPLHQLTAVLVGAGALLLGTLGIRSSSRIALRIYMLMTFIAVVCSCIAVKEGKYTGLEEPLEIIRESSTPKRSSALVLFADALLEAFGMIIQLSGIFVASSLCANLAPSNSKEE